MLIPGSLDYEIKLPCCGEVMDSYDTLIPWTCSRCWVEQKWEEQMEDKRFRLEQKQKAETDAQAKDAVRLERSSRITSPMDCHSDEFAARVKAIFGRKLEYGDGPLD